MSSPNHRLGVEVETESLAVWKWWRFTRKVKSFVEGEKYSIRFKFRNLGTRDFLGGNALMHVVWPVGTDVRWFMGIPPLEPSKSGYADIHWFARRATVAVSEAICSGFGLILCHEINSDDKRQVDLADFDGAAQFNVGQGAESIDSIRVTTWNEFTTRYGLVISAVGLLILALEKVFASF